MTRTVRPGQTVCPGAFEAGYFAAAYGADYARRNPPYKWRAFLRVARRFQPGGELLDVGCAYGLFLAQALRWYRCVGCDVSPDVVEAARRALPAGTPLFTASLPVIPTDRRYDVVTCFDVLEHVTDLDAALANIAGLLKPGGILVATMPVYDGPLGPLVDRLDHDRTHVHRRPRDFWVARISPVLPVRYVTGVWRYFFFGRWYLNLVSRASRRWTTAILVVAGSRPGQDAGSGIANPGASA
jgi:SAM-dependent methyltransferase